MPAKKTTERKELVIPPIQTKVMTFGIKGTSILVTHNWSEKSKYMLRLSAVERRKMPKETRDPDALAEAGAYKTVDGRYGIPARAIRLAMIEAAHKDLGIEKVLIKKSFFVLADDPNGVIPISFEREDEGPIVREDIVRVGANQTDLRYRPEFNKWRAIIRAVVDGAALREKDVLALVNRAGFGVGICECRPEKSGEWGRFTVDNTVEVTMQDVVEDVLYD